VTHVNIHFTANSADLGKVAKLVLVGRVEALQGARPDCVDEAVWSGLLKGLKGGDLGASRSTFTGIESPAEVAVCALPEKVARHTSPARTHAIHQSLLSVNSGKGSLGIHVLLGDADHAFASGLAVARAFSTFSRKSKDDDADAERTVELMMSTDGQVVSPTRRMIESAQSVRMAGHWVDSPCGDFNTDGFVEAARAVCAETGSELELIQGEDLLHQGYGGLWTVGKAAEGKPALAILKHEPEGAERTIAWVGKGVVYDTGGLSLKISGSMVGMKNDMGGAAGILGAFRAAVLSGSKDRIYALLCLAENAVDERAGRPDDIHQSYSGKTVEVNNTDAEGRLVLADGLAHATRHLNPDVILDMATLTGAQLVSTGRRHAALYCNDDELEALAMKAGRSSGDLTHPLPYAPEFYRADYKSPVADLRNTTTDRMNASSASAGWFLSNHLVDYDGPWIHVDIAGPAGHKDRGTGFGVGLLMDMFVPE
jgi:probable aminopeptidase NPEPL1